MIACPITGGDVDEAGMLDAAWLDRTVPGQTFGTYRPAGTRRMGRPGDPEAVFGIRCRVHGPEGLSVVDAPVMSAIVRATTNVQLTMVGERASELLIADAA
jgi:choline dehydrogenase-like flavoprotein